MKRIAILTAIVVGGLTAAGVTAQGLPGVTAIEHITGNLYRIPGAGGNTLVYVREHDVVLVDTKLPNTGESILAEVRKITNKPVGMIINTHSHPDHVGSNSFFLEANDAVKVVAQLNSSLRMGQASGPFPANRVDHSFTDRMTIGSGADKIELRYYGAGHTDGDAFVIFPAERAMTPGDIYAWHMSPLIDPNSGGSMLALPLTLAHAVHDIRDIDIVISGHGDVHSWGQFVDFARFNRQLVLTAEETLAEGGTTRDAFTKLAAMPAYAAFMGAELKPGLEYGGTPRSRAMINLTVAFQELRGEEAQLIMNLPPEQQ